MRGFIAPDGTPLKARAESTVFDVWRAASKGGDRDSDS
jgi:hypothetical protein